MQSSTETTRSPAADAVPGTLGAGGVDARLAPLHELVASDDVDVLSLDVFDTLLFRKVPEPVHAFELVARRLAERGQLRREIDPRLFSRLRQAAEWQARDALASQGGGSEVTLAQIYSHLPAYLYAGDSVDAVVEVELEVERELLVPDLDVFELVRAAREAGKRVVAVSDTYFSELQLRSFLTRPPAPAALPDRIFVSSAYGVGKASGLFSVVLRELRVPADRVVHLGDNPGADVEPPRRLGIRAYLFERRPKALEDLMEREHLQLRGLDPAAPALTSADPAAGDFGLAALRSKLLHRVEREEQPQRLKPFWDFGALVLGPVLTGFAEWVVREAEARGARRVQCLMREGELLAELINRAAPALGSEVTAEPLWLSRQVCARAALGDATREDIEALFKRRKLPTLRELCGTLGLDPETDLPAFADRADARLADGELGRLVLDAVDEDPVLRAKIVAASQATRRRVERLVESRLEPGRREVLLVDLGWGGTIQHLLDRALRAGDTGIHTAGYYLLTQAAAAGRMMGSELYGFLAQGGIPEQPVQAIMRAPEVLEQICMPEAGSQLDLNDDLEPVQRPADDLYLQAAERSAAQAGVFAFQRQWIRYGASVPWALPELGRAPQLLLALLARSVLHPTADEASAFGGWMHDEGFGSADADRIVAGETAAALPYVDPLGLTWDLPFEEVYWPFGLAALHDPELARTTALLHSGALPWQAVASELETGPVEFFADTGWGFSATGMVRVKARMNRHGRSFARATLRADYVRRVRIDPATGPCLVRLDWIGLRCWRHDEREAVTVRITGRDELGRLEVHGAKAIRPGLLMVSGSDPQVVLDVHDLAGEKLWMVEVSVGFAVLPLEPSRTRARLEKTKRRAASLAKDTPAVGRCVGFARKIARKLLRR